MNKIQIAVPDYLLASFDGIKGITITDKTVEFEGFTIEQAEAITARIYNKTLSNGNTYSSHDSLKVVSKSLGESELAKVQAFLPDTFDPKTMKAWKSASAFTMVDRDHDILTKDYLDAMAEEANIHNPALVFMHNGSEVKGTVFHSEVLPMNDPKFIGQHVLMQYFITNPKATMPGQPESNTIDYNLENGFLKYVSVSFGRYQSEFKQAGDDYVRIISRPSTGKVIHPELSLVYFGAQPGAGIKSIEPTRSEFSFKEFNPKIITPKTSFKMAEIKNEFKVGEKSFSVTAKLEGEAGSFIGTAELQTEINSALAEKNSALAEKNAAQKELADAKAPHVNKVLNLEGENGLKKSAPRTESELKSKSLAELQAIESDLIKELKAVHPTNQLIAEVPAKEVGNEKEATKSVSTLDKY